MTYVRPTGIADASSQLRRRPRRVSVRSESDPAMGSDTASHARATNTIAPIVAGAISSWSVENFANQMPTGIDIAR